MLDFLDAPSKREMLRGSSILAFLTEDDLEILVRSSKVAQAEKGEVIWLSGSNVDFIGIVGSGFVKMSTTGPRHQDITTEIMGPGQIFGLLGAIIGSGCPQCAKAITGTWYLKVKKDDFLTVYNGNQLLKEEMFQRAFNRLHQSFELIAYLSVGNVEQRIATVLLMLAKSFGKESEEGLLIDVPLTRQEISELAGTTVESTIRVISKWQKEKWVETHAKHILVHDRERLLSTARD